MAADNVNITEWMENMMETQQESNKNMDIFFVVTVSMIIFCEYNQGGGGVYLPGCIYFAPRFRMLSIL